VISGAFGVLRKRAAGAERRTDQRYSAEVHVMKQSLSLRLVVGSTVRKRHRIGRLSHAFAPLLASNGPGASVARVRCSVNRSRGSTASLTRCCAAPHCSAAAMLRSELTAGEFEQLAVIAGVGGNP
jgi:hypothetical protein